MTRSELIDRLASRCPGLTLADAIVDAMESALVHGDRIEIRGFGSFALSSRAPRIGRNPKTGELVQVPAKVVPHFKPGKELRAAVDLPGK